MAGGVHVRELKYLWRSDALQNLEHSVLSCSCGGTVLCCWQVQLAEQAAAQGQQGEAVLPFLWQHLLCQCKLQVGRAFLIVTNRDIALSMCDLEFCGGFSRDGLHLSGVEGCSPEQDIHAILASAWICVVLADLRQPKDCHCCLTSHEWISLPPLPPLFFFFSFWEVWWFLHSPVCPPDELCLPASCAVE